MLRPWTRSKKLRRACGGNPGEACTRHISRGLVSRRDAGRPKEQAHLSLGQERFTAPCRPRSTDPIHLSVWCGLSRPWGRRRPGAAGLQLRSHAAPSRRDRNQSRPGSARHYPPRSGGWHGAKALVVPSNISLVPLPPRAPELNSQENIWQFMRQNWLSNRIFKSFDDIVDHCCYAWNTLIDQPWKIMSIARRDWAAVGHSI